MTTVTGLAYGRMGGWFDATGGRPLRSDEAEERSGVRRHGRVHRDPPAAVTPAPATQPLSTAPVDASGDAAALTWRRSADTSLFLTTREGDVIELRISARDRGTASAATADDGTTAVSQFDLDARSKLKLSLNVKGDLNADELAAISKVVDQVGGLAQDFFDGNLPEAFAGVESLNIDASQLADVALRMDKRESFTYAALASSPAAAPDTAPALAPVAEASAPATEPAAASDTAVAPGAAPVAAATPPSANLAEALSRVHDFLGHLLDTLAKAPAGAGDKPAVVDLSFKLKLFQSVVTSASAVSTKATAADATPALPALVPDTLDALAASQAAPLAAVA